MSSFIHREVAKTKVNQEEVYVCMYVHGEILVNLSFFKKTEVGFEELLSHDVTPEVSKELIRKVRTNDVEKVTPEEYEVFNRSLDNYNFLMTRTIKEVVNKTEKNMKVKHVGEIAGFHYIVSKSKELDVCQIYMLQKSGKENGFEVGRIPALLIEMVILDYVHRVNINYKATYFMIEQNQFIALKRSNKNSRIISVIKIDALPETVSASKAYMIKEKTQHEYTLLSIQESTPDLMEGLKTESVQIINQFIKQMNLTPK